MSILHFGACLFAVGMLVVGSGAVSSQSYPNKPIRIMAPAAGGDSDILARLIAQGIAGRLGQPVIVDNRPVVIATEIASKAPTDGYTLLLAGGGTLWVSPLLARMSYDAERDFSPVTLVARTVNVLVVHPSVAANSVKELIALAKAKPGELNYGTSAIGSSSHLAAELFKYLAGVNLVRVNYNSAMMRMTSLISNEVQIEFSSTSIMPHVKAGKLRALAVTSAEPSALAPGLPTVAGVGVPGYEAVSVNGIFSRAQTPAAVINQLNQEIALVLRTPEAREKIFSMGSEAVSSSPHELAAIVKSDIAKWGKLIKDAGIKIN